MRRVILSVFLFLILSTFFWGMVRTAERRQIPMEEIREAGALLGEAKRCGAHIYASWEYRAAEASYDSAMGLWRRENERMFLLRDYNQVGMKARNASRLAMRSIELSALESGNLEERVERKIAGVQEMLLDYNEYFARLPLPEDRTTAVILARQALQEGIAAKQNEQTGMALEKVETAGRIIGQVNSRGLEILGSYFTGYTLWREWTEKTIRHSRTSGRSCILIDKYARIGVLLLQASPADTFEIELGPNWMGPKKHQGDRSTPEGIYHVKALKSGRSTGYYKALLLDYPNEEDRQRFHDRVRSGELDPGIQIGGMIEIHGHGGKGSDWTEGCIAVGNEDMDILFHHCKAGTEVVIVGSLRPIEEIIR